MSKSPENLLAKSDASIEWYWKHGIQRVDPRYEVARGSWLDAVYRIRARARAILHSNASAKPCMAIWGPSQTGKSTLLSAYLDDPQDHLGERSALKWSEEEPVRFVVGEDKSDRVIVLNPFNFGSDASGCVSRFVLRESVSDPLHPVEVVLATDAQLMHALAVGYLSECDSKNSQKEVTKWNAENFVSLLDKQKPNGPVHRQAFEALQQLADVLDLLVLSQLPRYEDLGLHWEKLRSQLLQTNGLMSSVNAVENFAFEVLWDSWPSLIQTFKALSTKRGELLKQWGDRAIRVSFRTAAVLLDIDSYKKCEEKPETRQKVDSLLVDIRDNSVCIGQRAGSPLVNGSQDFGYFQGLVWELKIPLRRDVLKQRAPVLHDFFEKADLLDFPGVANSYGNAEKHKNEDVARSSVIALTEVLKRGKTASIVVTSARDLNIDGFSLLMRLGRPPSQPVQLVSGIRSWLLAFGQQWPPNGRAMPLNLVMTFCSTLINQVIKSGPRDGLQGCFDQLKSIGYLADPKTVLALATNYPQFPEGHIVGTKERQEAALNEILSDGAFLSRFGESVESFLEMFKNGGTDYVFRILTQQALSSRRSTLVGERLSEASTHLQQLLVQHTPGQSAATDERNRAIDEWVQVIKTKFEQKNNHEGDIDSATKLSRYLRAFLNIDSEDLDDLPTNATKLKLNINNYIEKQFHTWQSKRGEFTHLHHIGLRDGAHATRVLSYLIEASDISLVVNFFKANLGHITSRIDAKHARRFLAVEMNNAMLNRVFHASKSHRPVVGSEDSVREALEKFSENEETHALDNCVSPHYITIIQPFIKRLEEVKLRAVGERPPQYGDDELLDITKLP
jgi:hypothetical protein